ncbi:MAG TPA: protein translocase subunit SecD, partial [Paracoccaceae bacterium]|nr:protein translocase subunit SecD [Paracoccaceae bacterium]
LLQIIGKTARLTFHPVIRAGQAGEAVGVDELLLKEVDRGGWLVVERAPVVTGDDLVDAQPSFDQNNRPAVSFRFDAVGARKFGDYTRDNVGKLFAIVLDDEIISAPQIQSHIPGGTGQITGNFAVEEAATLATLLRAGALPAAIRILEQRTVGPELGQDSIEAGTVASYVALAAVMVFMVASYGLFGLFAGVALAVNLVIIFAFMGSIGATLTLPGIAGIVLNIGMAVDANVLIFERIREELRETKRVAQAIDLGFDRALSAITDGNVTTLIACVIMYGMGSGPVRGFAVTLAIGTVASVFTAIYVTRELVELWLRTRRPKVLEL